MEKRPRIPEILPHQIAPTARHLPDDVTVYLDPEEAAGTIQRVYRGYRTRRELQGLGVTASLRWFGELEGLRQAPRDDFKGPNSSSDDDCISPARKHWHRAVDVAMRASKDDDQLVKQNGSDLNEGHSIFSKASPKTMDLQYFLEMVDAKHRHGSNLRVYHTVWKSSPSSENFFYWLDYGGGKNVELPQCSREQLEKDQVRYLSPEERFHYLVEVDDAGLFRWAKNNELVETDNSRFQDSLHGVVPVVDDVSQYEDNVDSGSISSQSDSASHLSSSLLSPSSRNNEDGEFSTLTQEDDELNKATKRFCRIRPAAVYDHFAGSLSIKDGMWIFVADTSLRIYIGIKEPGAFQHSSFVQGRHIAAAGMLKIRRGQLRSLAPLSGHYRPHLANFRAFHQSLQDRGVDLSRVSITKSYAILAGIESYTLTKRKIHDAHERLNEAKQKLYKIKNHKSK